MSISLKGAERFFAHALAVSTDEEQAAFFNEFGRLLPLVCKGSTGVEFQMAMLVRNLDGCGRETILELAEFVKLGDDRARTS